MRNTVRIVCLCVFALSMNAATVKDYGARGDGATDDTAAIQKAVNAVKSGTLVFPAGTYKLSHPIVLLSGVTYQGQAAKLQGNGGFWIFETAYSGSNETITGFTFDDGGLLIQGTFTNLTLTGNTFQNLTADNSHGDWGLGNAIFSGGGGLRGSKISGNTFKNLLTPITTSAYADYDGNQAMWFYGIDATSIDHNTFDHINEPIKICFNNTYPSSNVYIGYNTFTNIHRMGMEIQGAQGCGASKPSINGFDTSNMVIEYNSFTQPLNPYWWTYPISMANPAPYGGTGAIVRYNYLVSAVPSYGMNGPNGYGIEAADANMQIYGNTVVGPWGTGITYDGSPNSTIHDNFLCGLAPGATTGIRYETAPSPNVTVANNTIIPNSCPSSIPNPIATVAPPPPPTATVATPVISPPSGTVFSSPLTVSISDSTAGATIRYTEDGSVPSASSPVYAGAITLNDSATIKAIASLAGDIPSAVAAASYVYSPPVVNPPPPPPPVPTPDKPVTLTSDQFIWTPDLPVKDESVTYGPQQMVITVPGKANHDAFVGGNLAAKAFQNTPDVDFEATAKFLTLPKGAYEGEGIMVEQDNGVYLRFEIASDASSKLSISGASISSGKQSSMLGTSIASPSTGPMWLQVSRSGNVWTEYYSVDGVSFTKAAQFTAQLVVSKVGPYAWNYNATSANAPAMTALVDAFDVR